jgi:hypothetical protein
MRTIEIVIRGPKVVEVGYRAFLLVNAMTIGIGKVFAFNIDESVVVRVCGADVNGGLNLSNYGGIKLSNC